MRQRNVTGVILDPKSGDAGIASPGVGKSLRTVQRERDDSTTGTRLAVDPTTARKKKRSGKNPACPSLRPRHANNDLSFVMFILPG